MNSYGKSFGDFGADAVKGDKPGDRIKSHIGRTSIPGTICNFGGFGGIFRPDLNGIGNPVFVSSTDGVGTKLKIAYLLNKHDTIGIDCVAMSANNVVCSGAKPIFFQDYIAMGKIKPDCVAEIIKGIADGCLQAGCALIGGETAELPGFYALDEYGLAGFCVGMVDEDKLIDGSGVAVGDALIGIVSSGIHANGYSVVRHILRLNEKNVGLYLDDLGKTIGEELITPTRIYAKSVLSLLEKCEVNGIAHITGGGFYKNIPIMIPEGMCARIDRSSVRVHPIFRILQSMSTISEQEMYGKFNMGVGMVLAVPADQADQAIALLKELGEDAYAIGEVVAASENGEKIKME